MSGAQELIEMNGFWLSRELFETGYPTGGGPCACTSACCSSGVHVDTLERDRILAHAGMVKEWMDETQTTDESRWFDSTEMEDSDFPSGKAVATSVIRDKCAFLNGAGRCSIQLAAVNAGLNKWAIKPMFCILYPIVVQNNVVTFDDLLQEEQPCCSVNSNFEKPLFEACREELHHLLGIEGYHQIENYYREHYPERSLSIPEQEHK